MGIYKQKALVNDNQTKLSINFELFQDEQRDFETEKTYLSGF